MADKACVFAGQGAQFVGMGKDLAATNPEILALFDRANQVLGFDLKKVCFEGPVEDLTRSNYCQPAIFVASIAALEVFKDLPKSKNYTPKFTAGLSLGEAMHLGHTCAAGFPAQWRPGCGT